ncbi:hypothetical protein Aspvir_009678 [Aspergillus viridinutans]|uniref:NmrA-like domain-containing protein n=1 Tax=Aspergillus viridinutans TaxID=75553 RepID=A0A9P3C0B7_ASPVI|nr:uncharacterized protein Aspvir_009678 [Aspergillus viridinutans]GIK05565.1 hypothetical protein Aspvir_009678 [Aspergillus viridinutans]
MVTVAVAGGGSGIGLDIVQAVLDAKKHDVIVLSRSDQPHLSSQGADVRVVGYGSAEDVRESLRGVHTVISCIAAYGSNSTTSELALLEAAKQAGVARFVPSEWNSDCYDVVDLYSGKGIVWKAVQSSGLEYTRFINGLWMNVFGPGCVRDEEEALGAYKGRPPFAIDLKAGTAIITGDASQMVVISKTQDIGRFVAAALDLPKWEPESRIVGDRITFTEVAELAKSRCGRDIQIKVMPTENLKGLLRGNMSSDERFYYQLLLAIATGRMDF